LATPADRRLADWPGAKRRNPPRSDSTYAVRVHLARWIEEEAKRAETDFGRYRVLDIGCGQKPYYPYFAESVDEYVGVDLVEDNPMADLHAPVEDLPVEDGSFEVVLCTQVLEHCGVPDQAISELYRVTAPGGRVLVSTHGVQVYHPSPVDHWRWTHTGLELLFLRNGAWASVSVRPAGGIATCLTAIAAIYVSLGLRRAHLGLVARGLVWLLNTWGAALDRRFPGLCAMRPGSIFLNFHVVAEKPR
jgi:SAM-dependent methyltransferase